MERRLGNLKRNTRQGATAIEYALISFLIGATLLVVIQALGVSITGLYDEVEQEVSNATGS